MKKLLLLFIILGSFISLQAQVPKTVALTAAGTLSSTLTVDELNTVTDLTVTGNIDARDFRTMRDLMPVLADIDLSGASIAAYNGTEGTYLSNNTSYAANAIPESAFRQGIWQGKITLTSILLPASTIVISNSAFSQCSNLASISIPSSVTTIANAAFNNCAFTTITLPSSLTTIGLQAFYSCINLTSVSIPSSVTLIEYDVFGWCHQLESINVDASNFNFSSIDGVLFNKQQTQLIKFPPMKSGAYIVPSTVLSIDTYAFDYCNGITSLTFPNSIQAIGSRAFRSCIGLTSLNLPSSIKTIASGAFDDCYNLNSITTNWPVPLNLSSSYDVFRNIAKATCILNVPYGTASLYAAANQWKDFANIVEAPNGFSLSATTASIGSAANSQTTVELNANVSWTASSDQSWLTVSPASGTASATLTFTAEANSSVATRPATVTVSATGYDSQTVLVTQDGNDRPVTITAGTLSTMFSANELASITKLTLSGTIDARDFKTMRDLMPLLAEVDLSGASIVTYSGTEGTYGSNITYPANEVPRNAFYNKLSLTSVSIPMSATTIGRSAFYSCTALVSLTFEPMSQLTAIGMYAFRNCNKLVQVTLPSSVTIIDYGAFMLCSEITSFSIPTNLTTIGTYAFGYCSKLTAMSIPSNVTAIGDVVFLGSKATITVDANNLNYSGVDGVLFNKDQTRLMYCPSFKTGSFIIPSTVTAVAIDAFYNCSGITSITLPDGLATLEDWAFENCTGLTTISLPASLSSIGSDALYNCTGLTSIFVNNPVPVDLSSKTDVFFGINKNTCILNVPYRTASLYTSANQWKDFANIVEAPNGFSLAATSARIGSAAGSTTTVALNANVSWTAASDQAWLTLAPVSGSQSSTLTFTAEANTSITTRSATVTVSATGYDSQTVLVTQDNGPLNMTAGTLSTTLTTGELASLTKLTLTGTIDARDFKTMRDLMPLLAEIDLSDATIVAYSGAGGTYHGSSGNYAANAVPVYAFVNTNRQGKATLTSIKLPNSATAIQYSAFQSCPNLALVDISSSVMTIESAAFNNCDALISIQLPGSLISIGSDAFSSCDRISAITIPASVSSIGTNAFKYCSQLTSLMVDANNQYYMSEDGVLFNKSKTELQQCLNSKSGIYVIPSTVLTIKDRAFSGCDNLTSITIPGSVKTIANGSFESCWRLTSLEIPSSVTSIGSYAFAYCENLTSITAGRNVPVDLSFSDRVFDGIDKTSCILNVLYGAKALYLTAGQWKDFTHIVEAANGFSIGAATASVGAAANSTANVGLTANVSWVASSDQSWLTVSPALGTASTTLTFTATSANASIATRSAIINVSSTGFEPQTLIVIQEGVDIPVDLTAGTLSTTFTSAELAGIRKLTLTGTIDARDFKTMRDLMPMLAEVDLSGASIVAYSGSEGTYIGSSYHYDANEVPFYAFYRSGQGKTSLRSIELPDNATVISTVAFGFCRNLTSITFPTALKTIGSDAFYNCTGLTSLVLPNGLVTLEDWAFESCTGLITLSLPETLTSIGRFAFYNCSGLTKLFVLNPTPVDLSTKVDVFYNVNKPNCTLVVPAGSVDLYKAAYEWKDFAFIQANRAPVANAGTDQTVNKSVTVNLDGTASTDADGNTLTYQWTAPAGITLSSTTVSMPTFTAPNVSVDTQYTFALKVNDGSLDSEEDQIVVTVLGNLAPVANAGPDQVVNEGSLVTLNGSNSSDADEDVLTYTWTAPAGITLSGTTTSSPTFIAPEVGNDTQFTLSLIVNDGTDSSVADKVVITVKQVNKAPVADAGNTQIVNEGATVSLDGSESTDADGNSLSYNWIAPAGITLNSATISMPTFVAPMVDKDTDFYFSLSVNDGQVQSRAGGIVMITVKDLTHAPVANAGANQTVDEGATVTLDGSASTASNGGNLTYLWTAPAGITLSSTTDAKPTFTVAEVTADTPYTFSLEVNNGTTTSTADEVVVVIKQVNKAPVADAGATLTATDGSTVTLDGTKSVDADGDVLTYIWKAPEGITLSGTTTANPTFVAPSTATSTTYTFGLTVNDGKADSPQSTVTITVENNWTLSPTIAASSMRIYPNPFVGPVTIDMGEIIHSSCILSIYNIQGSLIIQKEINESKAVINLSDLVPGSYLLKVNSGNNVQSKILIKQ